MVDKSGRWSVVGGQSGGIAFVRHFVVWMLVATMMALVVTACSQSQLDQFKTGVDVANVIIQADKPTLNSLFAQGKITEKKRDEYLKIADGMNGFTNVTDGLTHFPPANAAELVTQANSLLTEIKPIIADETTHPVLAASLGAISGGLLLAIKKLGGTPVEMKAPMPVFSDVNEFVNQLALNSQKMREWAAE